MSLCLNGLEATAEYRKNGPQERSFLFSEYFNNTNYVYIRINENKEKNYSLTESGTNLQQETRHLNSIAMRKLCKNGKQLTAEL